MILPSDVLAWVLLAWVIWHIWSRARRPLPPSVRKGTPVYERRVALDPADVARSFKVGGR